MLTSYKTSHKTIDFIHPALSNSQQVVHDDVITGLSNTRWVTNTLSYIYTYCGSKIKINIHIFTI